MCTQKAPLRLGAREGRAKEGRLGGLDKDRRVGGSRSREEGSQALVRPGQAGRAPRNEP